jgi:DNA-binding CsgD family transcriptional regulator
MSATWHVPPPPRTEALDLAAVALLLDAQREPEPARAMLAFLNRLVPVEYLSLVSHVADAPALLEGHVHSAGMRNVVAECFDDYRRHFFAMDEATHVARRMRSAADSADVYALYVDAQDLPDPAWRIRIYERRELTDRLALLYAPAPGTAFSINLYRNRAMGRFGAAEIERVLGVAPLLRQVHRNAVATGAHAQATRIAVARGRLRGHAPQLSERELDVCARIACGISADGIAADLDIAPSSVVTLRKRAYTKLDVHDRVALMRLAG